MGGVLAARWTPRRSTSTTPTSGSRTSATPTARPSAASSRPGGSGDDLYVEAELPQEADTPGFGLHPALLDTSFHPYIAESGTAGLRVPFVFHGVRLHATGATGIRVRIRAAGDDRISLDVADGAGPAGARHRRDAGQGS